MGISGSLHTHRCDCGNEWSCERDIIPVRDGPDPVQRAKHSLDSEARLEDGLAKAFGSLNTLREDDFPDENKLRERFSKIMPTLEMLAVPREVPLSIQVITGDLTKARDEAETLAEEILSIFAELAGRKESPKE